MNLYDNYMFICLIVNIVLILFVYCLYVTVNNIVNFHYVFVNSHAFYFVYMYLQGVLVKQFLVKLNAPTLYFKEDMNK